MLKIGFRNNALIIAVLFILCSCNNMDQPDKIQANERVLSLDSLFNSAIAEQQIPAGVVYIAKHGKEVYHKAFGFKDIENGIPLKNTDIFLQ